MLSEATAASPARRLVHRTGPGETSSPIRERLRDDIFHGMRIAVGGPIPDASPERRDVNHGGIPRVRDHAMAPLEVEASNACPGLASISRTPRRRFESAGVKGAWVAGVDGNVVDVLVTGERVPPGLAAIRRNEDAALDRAVRCFAAPSCQVKAVRVFRIDSDAVRAVDAVRQQDSLPMFCSIA